MLRRMALSLLLLSSHVSAQPGAWNLGPGAFGSRHWRPPVVDLASLPASGLVGEVHLVLGTGELWAWTGSEWEPISNAYAPEAGHAASADFAATSATAAALAADPAPCAPGQFVSDIAASGSVTCSTPPLGLSGPLSATDNAVVRFDGTSGSVVQSSAVSISDAGGITAGLLTGSSNVGLQLRTVYQGNAKAFSIWNDGEGETAYVDSNGFWHINDSLEIRTDSLVGKLQLAPAGGDKGLSFASDVGAKWSSTTAATGVPDIRLYRDGAGVLKIENLLELTPIATAPACTSASDAGQLYHDNSPALCWCDGTSWEKLAGAGACI